MLQSDYLTEQLLLVIGSTPALVLADHCLNLDSDAWNRKPAQQAAQGQPRKYRVLMAHNGEVFEDCYAACCRLLVEESSWDAVPQSRRSQQFRAQAYASAGSDILFL